MSTEGLDIERILAVFRESDTNENGKISTTELSKLFAARASLDLSEDEVGLLLEMFDKNSDGELSEDEFLELVQRCAIRKS